VFEGSFTDRGVYELSGEKVLMGDFSALKDTGVFTVFVENLGVSYPFAIRPNLYKAAADASVKSFYFQRASMALEPQFAGKFARAAGHKDDSCWFHPSSGYSKGLASMPGGWYDAGDFNKYTVNAAAALGYMLSSYELQPGAFPDGSLNIPESGNGVSDLLDEMRYELNWLEKMQDVDGGCFFKVTEKKFGGFVMPADDKSQRWIVGKSTAASLDFAAVGAMVARCYAATDSVLAKKWLAAAERAWAWAKKNPSKFFQNPEDISTGGYPDTILTEEFFWAAAELYTATGKPAYLAEIEPLLGGIKFRLTENWRNYVDNIGYYSLLGSSSKLTAPQKDLVKAGLVALADSLAGVVDKSAYRIPISQFEWGSNSDVLDMAIVFQQAFLATQDAKYLNLAAETTDYIFGKNAVNYSFVSGFGTRAVTNLHHRTQAADGIAEAIPGFISGGPNAFMQDKGNLESGSDTTYTNTHPAKAFLDVTGSYASNELAINWNAPLVYVLVFMDAYGK
jgi:endoglucanase